MAETCRIAGGNPMSIEEWQALRASFKERDRDAEPPLLETSTLGGSWRGPSTRPESRRRRAAPTSTR